MKLIDSTVSEIARPGQITRAGVSVMKFAPSNSSRPQVGKSDGKPSPRKRQRALGDDRVRDPERRRDHDRRQHVRQDVPGDDPPRAACRSTSPPARTRAPSAPARRRARCARSASSEVMPMMNTISRKMPVSGPNIARSVSRNSMMMTSSSGRIGSARNRSVSAHQEAVEPAEVAREHPDQRAEEQREQHRGDADRQRHPPALQDLGEDVAADVVGAHRMRAATAGVAGARRRCTADRRRRARARRSPRSTISAKITTPTIAPRCLRNWRQTSPHRLRCGVSIAWGAATATSLIADPRVEDAVERGRRSG